MRSSSPGGSVGNSSSASRRKHKARGVSSAAAARSLSCREPTESARAKNRAPLPSKSRTTFTMLGSMISFGCVMAVQGVAIWIGFVLEHRGDHRIHRARIDQRLVTLHVHVDFRCEMRGHFGHAVRAGAVIGARQDGFAAEDLHGLLDALVFGGHDHARRRARLPDALDHVLDHRACRQS